MVAKPLAEESIRGFKDNCEKFSLMPAIFCLMIAI